MSWHKLSATQTEAHTIRTEPEYQGSALADFQAKAAATESVKTVAHVEDVGHSASAKMAPQCQTLVILMFL